MSSRTAGIVGLALVVVMVSAVTAHEPASSPGAPHPRVEIPSVGISLAFPAGWRGGVTSDEVRTAMVGDLSPSLRGLQTWVLYAEAPPEEAWCAVADMTLQVSGSDCSSSRDSVGCVEQLYRLWSGVAGKDVGFLDLPAGRTMQITSTLQDGSFASDYYFTDAESWMRLYCEGATDAARDDWRAIAESFAFVERSTSNEPILQVEVPEGGFAIAFPADWGVRTAGLDQAAEGAELHLAAQRIDGECTVWRWDVAIDGVPAWAGLAGFADYFIHQNRAGADRLEATEVVLLSGQAKRVRDRPSEDVARVAYLLANGSAYHSVTCVGPAAHEERWLSIVESFEFIPAE